MNQNEPRKDGVDRGIDMDPVSAAQRFSCFLRVFDDRMWRQSRSYTGVQIFSLFKPDLIHEGELPPIVTHDPFYAICGEIVATTLGQAPYQELHVCRILTYLALTETRTESLLRLIALLMIQAAKPSTARASNIF